MPFRRWGGQSVVWSAFEQEEEEMAEQKKPWYVEQSPEIGGAFQEFYQKCKDKSCLEDKTRELLMLALACSFRCPHCTEEHIKKALEVGASKGEVAETLLITAVEGAGTQLYWAKDVYEKHLGGECEC
jgi:AhpD family alkylhydroperoxidase